MKETRDVLIELLLPDTGETNQTLKIIRDMTKGLKSINTDVLETHGQENIYYRTEEAPESFRHREKDWLFYIDDKLGNFWVQYYSFHWTLEHSRLDHGPLKLSQDEILNITRLFLENELGRALPHPKIVKPYYSQIIDDLMKKVLG